MMVSGQVKSLWYMLIWKAGCHVCVDCPAEYCGLIAFAVLRDRESAYEAVKQFDEAETLTMVMILESGEDGVRVDSAYAVVLGRRTYDGRLICPHTAILACDAIMAIVEESNEAYEASKKASGN